MNDRFKFRIWHEGEMHYNDFVITSTGYAAKIDEEFLGKCVFNQENLEFNKQAVVMQCTGLKDRNSKFIYEGDIVEVINCRGANAVVEYNLEGAKFMLKGEKFAPSTLQHIRKDYFEVIGNIYENEELLDEPKSKKKDDSFPADAIGGHDGE